MSKVIRISEETFIRLQELAEPLVDTPATVIDRLLDFYEREQRNPERVRQMMERLRPGPSDMVMESSPIAARLSSLFFADRGGDFEYEPIVPSLFLVRARPEHVEATVERAVPYAKAERFIIPRQRIQLKRALEDATTFHCHAMPESNRPVFESMRPGDYVLLGVAESARFSFLARIVTRFESEELGRELWPAEEEDDDEPLSLIYAVENVQRVMIDQSKLDKALGYSPDYSLKGAMRVDPKRLEAQLVRFGSVEGLLFDL